MYRNLHNSTRMTNNKMLTFQDMYEYLYIQIIVNKSCTSNNDTSFHEQDE